MIKAVVLAIILYISYRILIWIFNRLDIIFHRSFHSHCITMWSAVTDRATYRLVTDRQRGFIMLYRTSFKWGKEERIMKRYFLNLSQQMLQINANPLTFTDHIVEDVTQHIEKYYGENITTSGTN